MTSVRVSCPLCAADIQMEATGFLLTVQDNGNSRYEYFCPQCREYINRPADARARSLLTLAHARTITITVPLEFLQPKSGLPISAEDIASFDLAFEEWSTACCAHPWT